MFDQLFLIEKAKKIRVNILKMISIAGSGHPGGSLSIVEILVYLYFYRMKVDPSHPKSPERDRFILSKGHCCPAWYAVLAEKGFFNESVLWTLRDIESILQGHPDMKKTPGVDMTSGSLGQGLSCGVGMAIGSKLSKKNFFVYVLVGDGELQSGQIWEAVLCAAKYNLNNLIVIVDNNKFQTDGKTSDIMPIEPIEDKFKSFKWFVTRINGHSFHEIHNAFEMIDKITSKPKVIIADTIKGKGVSFMENNHLWHGLAPNEEETKKAISEIIGYYYDRSTTK